MEIMEDRWRGCRPIVTELVGFVLAVDACPFGAGIAKGSSLRFIWGQDFLNRGHVDRVQPMNPPLKFSFGRVLLVHEGRLPHQHRRLKPWAAYTKSSWRDCIAA